MTPVKALEEISALAGAPGVNVLRHLPDIVERVKALAERAETARIVSAENAKLTARLRALGARV